MTGGPPKGAKRPFSIAMADDEDNTDSGPATSSGGEPSWRDYAQAFSDVIEALERVDQFMQAQHFTTLDLFRGEADRLDRFLRYEMSDSRHACPAPYYQSAMSMARGHYQRTSWSTTSCASTSPSPTVRWVRVCAGARASRSGSRVMGWYDMRLHAQARHLVDFLDGNNTDEIEYPELDDALKHVCHTRLRWP